MAWSPSSILMRRSKGADRASLHARRPAWAVGAWAVRLVRGRGGAVSGRAASRRVVAAARTPGHPAARIHPRWHDQDPDPVSSRIRPGAAAPGGSRHQCGAASLAARAPERDPGDAPRSTASLDPAATQAAWAVWQAGLTRPFTLPHDLPPLRLLLVWDNLAGHKTPDLVLWLCEHGVMPLYTPVGGSWLNMAESIERVLKRRALDGQHP